MRARATYINGAGGGGAVYSCREDGATWPYVHTYSTKNPEKITPPVKSVKDVRKSGKEIGINFQDKKKKKHGTENLDHA